MFHQIEGRSELSLRIPDICLISLSIIDRVPRRANLHTTCATESQQTLSTTQNRKPQSAPYISLFSHSHSQIMKQALSLTHLRTHVPLSSTTHEFPRELPATPRRISPTPHTKQARKTRNPNPATAKSTRSCQPPRSPPAIELRMNHNIQPHTEQATALEKHKDKYLQ